MIRVLFSTTDNEQSTKYDTSYDSCSLRQLYLNNYHQISQNDCEAIFIFPLRRCISAVFSIFIYLFKTEGKEIRGRVSAKDFESTVFFSCHKEKFVSFFQNIIFTGPIFFSFGTNSYERDPVANRMNVSSLRPCA